MSRYIDPGSGDFLINDQVGQFAYMPSLRQRVLLIMNTRVRSSTAMPDLGIPHPKKIDQAYVTTTRNAVLRAFYQLTNVEKVMRIEDVIIERPPATTGRISITLVYTDLTQGNPGQQVTSII